MLLFPRRRQTVPSSFVLLARHLSSWLLLASLLARPCLRSFVRSFFHARARARDKAAASLFAVSRSPAAPRKCTWTELHWLLWSTIDDRRLSVARPDSFTMQWRQKAAGKEDDRRSSFLSARQIEKSRVEIFVVAPYLLYRACSQHGEEGGKQLMFLLLMTYFVELREPMLLSGKSIRCFYTVANKSCLVS